MTLLVTGGVTSGSAVVITSARALAVGSYTRLMWRIVLPLALALAALPSPVAAKRVIMEPTLVRMCRGAKPWNEIEKCAARFGKVKILRAQAGVRLIRILSTERLVPGIYLYVEQGREWRLAGMDETEDYELLGFKPMKYGSRTGYRIDLGSIDTRNISDDPDQIEMAVLQVRKSIYCNAIGHRCSALVTACDLFVDGKSLQSFRGKVVVDATGHHAKVVGDRSRAGTFCAAPEEVWIGFGPDLE